MKSFASSDHDQEEDARFKDGQQKGSPSKPSPRETALAAEVPETQEEQDGSESDDMSVQELRLDAMEDSGRAGDEEFLV